MTISGQGARTLADMLDNNAWKYPNETAFVWGDQRMSHGVFHDRVSRLANALHRLGLKRQDRVGILSVGWGHVVKKGEEWWISDPLVLAEARRKTKAASLLDYCSLCSAELGRSQCGCTGKGFILQKTECRNSITQEPHCSLCHPEPVKDLLRALTKLFPCLKQ